MRDIERRLGRLEDTSSPDPCSFEFWATAYGTSTNMTTKEAIPSEDLKDRPLPKGARQIVFVRSDKTAETGR
jgi:hypothetical protein